MVTEALKHEIVQALVSPHAQSNTDRICRTFIEKQVNEKYPTEGTILKPLMECISCPLAWTVPPMAKQGKIGEIALWLVGAGTLAGCLLLDWLCKAPVWGTVVGFVCTKLGVDFLPPRKKVDALPLQLVPQVTTRPEEVATFIQQTTGRMWQLAQIIREQTARQTTLEADKVPANWFETRYSQLLRWFRDNIQKYRKKDENLTEDMLDFLDEYGYELIDYSPEHQDKFELNLGDVEAPKTTRQALINRQTRDCIVRGYAVLPQ